MLHWVAPGHRRRYLFLKAIVSLTAILAGTAIVSLTAILAGTAIMSLMAILAGISNYFIFKFILVVLMPLTAICNGTAECLPLTAICNGTAERLPLTAICNGTAECLPLTAICNGTAERPFFTKCNYFLPALINLTMSVQRLLSFENKYNLRRYCYFCY